jgi:hypothetical protein
MANSILLMQAYQNLKLLYNPLSHISRFNRHLKNILRFGSKNVLAYSLAEAIHVVFYNKK